tara:strand:+ start:1001 stop:1147 length:147 start_codon:yes stop_codon:yes gene_type:complete
MEKILEDLKFEVKKNDFYAQLAEHEIIGIFASSMEQYGLQFISYVQEK